MRQSDALLFAVPNGEKRDALTAARLSGISAETRATLPDDQALLPAGQGVVPGVNDLVVVLPVGRTLWVELKIPEIVDPPAHVAWGGKRRVLHKAGVLSKEQRRWRAGVEKLGHDYRVVRSVSEYADLLEEHGVPLRSRPWEAGVPWRAPLRLSVAS